MTIRGMMAYSCNCEPSVDRIAERYAIIDTCCEVEIQEVIFHSTTPNSLDFIDYLEGVCNSLAVDSLHKIHYSE